MKHEIRSLAAGFSLLLLSVAGDGAPFFLGGV